MTAERRSSEKRPAPGRPYLHPGYLVQIPLDGVDGDLFGAVVEAVCARLGPLADRPGVHHLIIQTIIAEAILEVHASRTSTIAGVPASVATHSTHVTDDRDRECVDKAPDLAAVLRLRSSRSARGDDPG